MAKVNPAKKIQRRRTEAEMHKALQQFNEGKPQHSLPVQDDDSDIVLSDCIEELLEARAMLEDIRQFVQSWSNKFSRK